MSRRQADAENHGTVTDPLQDAVRVARDLVERAKPYASEVQASLLLAVGIRTHQARAISRWMGIGLLVPGCLDDLATVRLACWRTQSIVDALMSSLG